MKFYDRSPSPPRLTGTIVPTVVLLSMGPINATAANAASIEVPAYLFRFPHFSQILSPDIPGDIDTTLERRLSQEGRFTLVQREFELYAWQMFIAINWPIKTDGSSATSFLDLKGTIPRWQQWLPSSWIADLCNKSGAGFSNCGADKARAESLSEAPVLTLTNVSTLSAANILQAAATPSTISAPLIDQMGNFVYYSSFVDPNQVAYLRSFVANKGSGQTLSVAVPHDPDFPSGQESRPWSGSFTIKQAWRILEPSRGDDASRYLTRQARVLDLRSNGSVYWRNATVGLVGIHIVHKTERAPERIWATFEQVDNLAVDRVETPTLHASFFNPGCLRCKINQPSFPILSRLPTQVARTYPISAETQGLNVEIQSFLSGLGSVLRFYQLVGVQWPAVSGDPSSATPPEVANPVMETYVETAGVSEQFLEASAAGENDRAKSVNANTPLTCISCHALAPGPDPRSPKYKSDQNSHGGDFSWYLSSMFNR